MAKRKKGIIKPKDRVNTADTLRQHFTQSYDHAQPRLCSKHNTHTIYRLQNKLNVARGKAPPSGF